MEPKVTENDANMRPKVSRMIEYVPKCHRNQIFDEDWPQDVILGALYTKMEAARGFWDPLKS